MGRFPTEYGVHRLILHDVDRRVGVTQLIVDISLVTIAVSDRAEDTL